MASVDQSLDAAININEAFAAALVDYESGMMLGSRGGSPEFDMEVAAPGNSEVVRTELEVMQKLGLREAIDDMLITLETQYHLIRPIRNVADEKLFFYLVLNRKQANLGMARRDLRVIENAFFLASLSPDRLNGSPENQMFYPSNAGR
jgi:hypothetical protein